MLIDELNLIRKVVWSYVRTHPGLEFDDLFSEACIACIEAEILYDPARSKRSTYIYNIVQNRLNNLIHNEKIRHIRERPVDMPELEGLAGEFELSPEQQLLAQERWDELLAGLSPEAMVVWGIVNEKDFYLNMDKPKLCRGLIVGALRRAGWSWGSIWNVFRELKEAVSVIA